MNTMILSVWRIFNIKISRVKLNLDTLCCISLQIFTIFWHFKRDLKENFLVFQVCLHSRMNEPWTKSHWFEKWHGLDDPYAHDVLLEFLLVESLDCGLYKFWWFSWLLPLACSNVNQMPLILAILPNSNFFSNNRYLGI